MLEQSIYTSLIDKTASSEKPLRHDLIANSEIKMISELKTMLNDCDEFLFSIAFMTKSGLIQIKHELQQLETKKIKGKIITGDYLNFTEPKALRELSQFKNIEVKMYSGDALHAKGYFFKKNDLWTMYIGSSNLTQRALTINKEWNLKFTATETGEIVQKTLKEYQQLFKDCQPLEQVIDLYEEYYHEQKRERETKDWVHYNKFLPNKMQQEALNSIEKSRHLGRGLLISATGTGKTVLSALDVKAVNPKKILYLVHQGNIAIKASETFKQVMPTKNIGYHQDGEYDYLFMTIQTISKDENLKKYRKDQFDYIIIDEVHRAGAATYQKIIDYFTPKYLLGMTATPERSDEINIYQLFNYNIVYEIRLYQALEAEMLCPFNYFGITDLQIENKPIDDNTKFNEIEFKNRVQHVLDKSKFYGYSGKFLSCLLFVANVSEGLNFEKELNNLGHKAVFLSAQNSVEERENKIRMFEEGFYNYIITVNIFNEGIDIACVNQIILLRPTTSSIIYIQQLGRGLRKFPGKDYVVVLDFIANYKTSFLNAQALSQNNSGEKDILLKFLINPNDSFKGCSTITFDEISKKTLYHQISQDNSKYKKQIKNDYLELTKRLNRKVRLKDFIEHKLTSPRIIIEEYKTISNFYQKMGEEVVIDQGVEFLGKYYLQPKRVHEYEIIKFLITNPKAELREINQHIENKYQVKNQEQITDNALKHLTKTIFTSFSEFKKYEPIIKYNQGYYLAIKNNQYLQDILLCQEEYLKENNFFPTGKLVVGELYSKLESALYGLVDYNNSHQVNGYNYYKNQNVVFAYINFEGLNRFDSYDNMFLNNKEISYFSKSGRSLTDKKRVESKMAQDGVDIHLFGRKNISKKYYYLGLVKNTISAMEITREKKEKVEKLIKYKFNLEREVRKDIYDYLVSKND